jgi:sterol 3beta-glucosyltransferase
VLDTDEPSDEQKLAAVIEEFGDIASLMERDDGEGSEPERLLAESKGSLFK